MGLHFAVLYGSANSSTGGAGAEKPGHCLRRVRMWHADAVYDSVLVYVHLQELGSRDAVLASLSVCMRRQHVTSSSPNAQATPNGRPRLGAGAVLAERASRHAASGASAPTAARSGLARDKVYLDGWSWRCLGSASGCQAPVTYPRPTTTSLLRLPSPDAAADAMCKCSVPPPLTTSVS